MGIAGFYPVRLNERIISDLRAVLMQSGSQTPFEMKSDVALQIQHCSQFMVKPVDKVYSSAGINYRRRNWGDIPFSPFNKFFLYTDP